MGGSLEGWRVASKRLGPLPRIERGALRRGCGREGSGALPLPRMAGISTRLRVLRRDVLAVCVVVALGGDVRGTRLEGREPSVHVRQLAGGAQRQALPVEERCEHALDVRDVLQVDERGRLATQEPSEGEGEG